MNEGNPSIWHRVCQLEGEHLQTVKAVYDQKLFPIEFRHYFASMIESEDWNSINPDNHNDFTKAKGRRHFESNKVKLGIDISTIFIYVVFCVLILAYSAWT